MIVAKFLLISFLALTATKTIPDGFEKGGEVPVTIISRQKSVELFEEFRSHHEIPFDYPVEGCYSRATAMVRIAESQHIEMGKVFIQGELSVKTKSLNFGTVDWTYHVAPVLYVKDGASTKLMVFDPSLFDKPVTVDLWKNEMLKEKGTHLDRLFYSARYQVRPDEDKKKYGWLPDDLQEADSDLKIYSSVMRKIKSGSPLMYPTGFGIFETGQGVK
ncbi:MAG TPA: protein-glutamine glutaminase family protein [Bdellovibrio sp.]|nr:protein-glutamine glutaminase family protein [Bdellovibrio sp.]